VRPTLRICWVLPFVAEVLTGCSGSLCGNDKIQAYRSPDGSMTAYLFRRSCGATTGFSTHVSLLPAGRTLPNDGGNVLSAGNEQVILIEWAAPQVLQITGVSEPVYQRHDKVYSVSVQFR